MLTSLLVLWWGNGGKNGGKNGCHPPQARALAGELKASMAAIAAVPSLQASRFLLPDRTDLPERLLFCCSKQFID
ncbi:MAG: hypothetical protein HUJ55_07735 [Ileibacterium sp.]|nr:hypothetical protein [Ileibacterium sp.]